MKAYFCSSLFYLLLSPLIGTAQNTTNNTIIAEKSEYNLNQYDDEKIHLHLDKPYYAAGDIIWLKAYVVDYTSNKPSATSGVVYADLINEKNGITKQLKLPLKGGTAWGSIELPDTLSEGNYRIRAYTQWMRNSGKNYFFNQNLKIGNSLSNNIFAKTIFSITKDNSKINSDITLLDREGKPYPNKKVTYQIIVDDKKKAIGNATTDANGLLHIPFNRSADMNSETLQYVSLTIPEKNGTYSIKTIPIQLKSNKVDIQFLPEGGELIDGLPSKIGIKAIDENGLGENVTGIIVDNTGVEVTSFETIYLGMGHCILTPEINKTYTAKIKLPDGTITSYRLPSIAKVGYRLMVNTVDSNKIDIKVAVSDTLLNSGQLRLVGQHGKKILFDMAIPTHAKISSISLPKNKFASGVIQLTLFNSEEKAVSERMIFINNSDIEQIELDAKNLKSDYDKRGLVEFSVKAQQNGDPIQGSFSVAVTNASVVNPDSDNETNILSSLLLKSELAGFIEKPNSYFIKNDEQSRIRLDNLMLTQAWRKIDWRKQDSTRSIVKYLPEKNLKIAGSITNLNKKRLADANAVLMFPNNKMLVANVDTDENGKFSFEDVYLENENKFIIQASTKEGKKHVTVNIDKTDEQEIKTIKNPNIDPNVNFSINNYLDASEDYFNELYKKGSLEKTTTLKTVNIVQRKNPMEEMTAEHSTNKNGRGRADKVITSKDLELAHSLGLFLSQGRVAGLTTERSEEGVLIAKLTRPPWDVSIELDGMIINDFDLDQISVDDIESIEVLINPALLAVYGTTINGGLLVISLKRGKGRSLKEIHSPGLVVSNIKGYTPTKQFYSPKYDVTKDDNPDLRTTVYWNAQVISDEKGNINFSYYNTDRAGKHRVVIEGIDADGNLARKVLTYEVK